MSPEDGTIAQGAAQGGVSSSDGAGATAAGEGAPAPAPDAADPYADALDAYMGQRYAEALSKVDAALERSPESSARSKLERLRRRTTEKIAKEPAAAAPSPAAAAAPTSEVPPAEAAAPVDAPAAEPPAATETAAPVVATEPAAAEPVAAETPAPTAETAPTAEATSEAPAPTAEAPASTSTGAQAAALLAAAAAPAPAASAVAEPPKRPPAKRPSSASTPTSTVSPATGSGRQPAVAPPKKAPPPVTAPAARPPGAPGPSPLALLRPELDKVTNELDRVNKSVGLVETHIVKVAEAYQKLAKDQKRKEQAYDQLYEELRQYKANFLAESQRPLLKDVILVFDGIARSLAGFEAVTEATLDKKAVVDAFTHVKDELLEVLYRRDIERITERPSKLDVGFQKPVERIATDKPEEDRDITQVLREGFRLNGVVLRPQEVVVKRHGSTTSTSTSSEEGGA